MPLIAIKSFELHSRCSGLLYYRIFICLLVDKCSNVPTYLQFRQIFDTELQMVKNFDRRSI